jgi:hypothetical protein
MDGHKWGTGWESRWLVGVKFINILENIQAQQVLR